MASDVFSGWTDQQLRDYLSENGQMPPPAANRNQLIDSCVQVGSAVETQLSNQRYQGNGAAMGIPATTRAGTPPSGALYNPAAAAAAATSSIPHAMPPPGGPRKKALIIGINYFGSPSQLQGCINDARCMHYLLTHRLGFREDAILFMTDDHPDPSRRPIKNNIFSGIQWLMTGLHHGDSLFFHYSGHGSQQRDPLGIEADGLNETLCPVDHRYAGEIVDDDLNRMLVNPLPQGVKLHSVIDACHSGSVLDLPLTATCHHGYLRWESEVMPGVSMNNPYKGTNGGFAVQFGASRDHQTAADTAKLSGGVPTGAATFSFISALERRGLIISYGDLLVEMYNTLARAGLGASSGGGGGGGFLGGLLLGGGGGFRGQEPVMSANYAFDLNFKMEI
jgi:hypothetical protein